MEIVFFKKLFDFSKEMNFRTVKRGNIGKRDEIAKDYLSNTTINDPFGKDKIKSKYREDLFSTSLVEEDGTYSYEKVVKCGKYASQSIWA